MSAMGASREDATKFLAMAKNDVDVAAMMYLERDVEEAEEAAVPEAASVAPSAATVSAIEAIVTDAKGRGKGNTGDDGADPPAKGAGKGKGKSTKKLTVHVVFFSDGFIVEEMDEEKMREKEEAAGKKKADNAADVPKPRRTGMMSLDDLRGQSKGPMPEMPELPELPPLRPYAGNEAFVKDLQEQRLPQELQRTDENGDSIQISLGIADQREESYAELKAQIDTLKQKKEEMESKLGGPARAEPTRDWGAGQALGSSSGSGAAAATNTPGAPVVHSPADAAIVAMATGAPSPSVDPNKPLTNLNIRFTGAPPAKVQLNQDHSVADLWRVVAEKMGHETFRAKTGHALVAGFPPKPLLDPSATLKAADLINAAVTHRTS